VLLSVCVSRVHFVCSACYVSVFYVLFDDPAAAWISTSLFVGSVRCV